MVVGYIMMEDVEENKNRQKSDKSELTKQSIPATQVASD